jgi:hypothetical protein
MSEFFDLNNLELFERERTLALVLLDPAIPPETCRTILEYFRQENIGLYGRVALNDALWDYWFQIAGVVANRTGELPEQEIEALVATYMKEFLLVEDHLNQYWYEDLLPVSTRHTLEEIRKNIEKLDLVDYHPAHFTFFIRP